MIELIFAACLSTAPETCMDRSIWFIDKSQTECRDLARTQLDKWGHVNPGWTVGAWTCALVDNRNAGLITD